MFDIVHIVRKLKKLFMAKYLCNEDLSAFRIPILASLAYEKLIELINEPGGKLVNIDPKIYEDAHLSIFDKQITFLLKKLQNNGWYKFFGKYPWDYIKDSTVLQKF